MDQENGPLGPYLESLLELEHFIQIVMHGFELLGQLRQRLVPLQRRQSHLGLEGRAVISSLSSHLLFCLIVNRRSTLFYAQTCPAPGVHFTHSEYVQ